MNGGLASLLLRGLDELPLWASFGRHSGKTKTHRQTKMLMAVLTIKHLKQNRK
jgi:hypothetical protein